jgi:hypothetical protein
MFITLSFILNAKIGFNLDTLLGLPAGSYTASYILAAVLSVGYILFVKQRATKQKDQILQNVLS